jgi:SAM-dependent methyltransferase
MKGELKQQLKKRLPDDRSFEQIKNHYEVERAIAARLKQSSREEREAIYRTMYDELFQKVPDHPRLKQRESKELTASANNAKWGFVKKFIDKSTVFAEFAPGDCQFAMEVCKHAKFVYGIDISDQKGQMTEAPNNFKLVIYNGYHLEFEESSVDVVFSDWLIEHLHPQDTMDHFQLAKQILKKNGLYLFRTPHKFSGPHDISEYFSDEPEGFHLKEWTYTELAELLKALNYSSWHGYYRVKGMWIKMPFTYLTFLEKTLRFLPTQYRKFASKYFLQGIFMVAVK